MTIIPYSINRKELWDRFVGLSANGSFQFQRDYMDFHADRFFDCSVLIFDGKDFSEDDKESALDIDYLQAVFPANWVEDERCVYSSHAVDYGGLIVREGLPQREVTAIVRQILLYYQNFLQARKLVCCPIPYIYSATPAAEDLYALSEAGGRLTARCASGVVTLAPGVLRIRPVRVHQAKHAIEYGYYIDRLTDGDAAGLALFHDLLTAMPAAGVVPSVDEMSYLLGRFRREMKLYLVRHGREIVAGMLACETRRVVCLKYMTATAESLEHGALDLLLRHLITERYKQMQYVDFGPALPASGDVFTTRMAALREDFSERAVCCDTYEVRLDNLSLTTEGETEVRPIPYLDLRQVNAQFEPQLTDAVCRVVQRGWYLLGEEVARFEQEYAEYTGSRHCVAVANGLEALTLILMACKALHGWNDGDEVIVPANTYIASILAVSNAGFTPVPCEPRLDTLLIDPEGIATLVGEHTRAIMPVHLYGRLCDLERINAIAAEHGLLVIDDVAQAHGASLCGRRVGSLCYASGFSFYPGKNLGALGDAGAVTTDDELLAQTVRRMANYGCSRKYVHDMKGMNSRMDELQAAALRVKLPRLDADNEQRRQLAAIYLEGIVNPLITLPTVPSDPLENVWHVFPIRCPERDRLQAFLSERGIQALVHYPIPPHQQGAYAEWNNLHYPLTERIHREELSLPISPLVTDDQARRIVEVVNAFV